MFRFGDAMSIFARSTCAPSGNSAPRIRVNRSRFSATRPVAVRTVAARLGQRAAVGADLLGAQAVDIGLAFADQLDGELDTAARSSPDA